MLKQSNTRLLLSSVFALSSAAFLLQTSPVYANEEVAITSEVSPEESTPDTTEDSSHPEATPEEESTDNITPDTTPTEPDVTTTPETSDAEVTDPSPETDSTEPSETPVDPEESVKPSEPNQTDPTETPRFDTLNDAVSEMVNTFNEQTHKLSVIQKDSNGKFYFTYFDSTEGQISNDEVVEKYSVQKETQNEIIPFPTQVIRESSELPKGTKIIITDGVDGKQTKTIISLISESGITVKETIITGERVEPVTQQIAVGTKEEPVVPVVPIEPETPTEPTTPVEPSEPSKPVEPEQPTTPEKPKPEEPKEPSKPDITTTTDELTIPVDKDNNRPFNPNNLVDANDKKDGNLTDKVKIIANNVDTSRAGTYEITYAVTNSSGNTTTRTVKVNIVESGVTNGNMPVIFTPKQITIKTGDMVDFEKFASAVTGDGTNKDITNRLRIEGNYNRNKVGEYNVFLSVTDESGRTTQVPLKIIVKDQPEKTQEQQGDEFKRQGEKVNTSDSSSSNTISPSSLLAATGIVSLIGTAAISKRKKA